MKSKTIIFLFATLFVSLTTACSDSNDLGVSCKLQKKDANNNLIDITEKEAREALAGSDKGDKGSTLLRDLVALGIPECEDLVCVRDAGFDPGSVADTAAARGYCSMECTSEGSACKASGSKDKYVCRQLMLDPETLERACESNPAYCTNRKSTRFCVRDR